MQKLTTKEEEIMQALWKLEKGFIKEIMAEIPGEQHYNTLSTFVRILEDKGFVAHNNFGKTYQYFPLVSKEEYKKKSMNVTIENYFNSSYKNMVSFFAKEKKITAEELREILEMVEKENKND
ncbi:transcriptional regulator [Flavobacterium magnum]|uniref:Transcriptional regulator n=1 Tax=Flavobacterium magnum TaxID=2162713 RepID=A0A2S0RII8_9FLAO|nr:BlaI/MecI/CopY family transcriptional regulator [Flavobacterium magnum]AWA31504.1 transcriptional regulator [Flavobacterium magnum]